MYFKHPEILYALFALIIPVIIHLFQLQRFEKVSFTNVKLLKQIEQESRKSSTLKKWLILLSRLLLFAALIIAFAQPYHAKNLNKKKPETIIYLDNSLSMLAKGKKGSLLQSGINDLIENYKNSTQKITLITNNKIFKNIGIDQKILSIEPTPFQKNLKQILLQINSISPENRKNARNIILISDLQGEDPGDLQTDTINRYYFIDMKPVKAENIFIDSIWISGKDNENITLKTRIRNFNTPEKDINISLFIGKRLEGKTSITSLKNQIKEVAFSVSSDKDIQGKIHVDASDLLFDNTKYFSLNIPNRIRVLSIGKNDAFLDKIYNNKDFIYTHKTLRSLDFNLINSQDLILLNRVEKFETPLIRSLKTFTEQGGNLVIIPAENIDLTSYNRLFSTLNLGKIREKVTKKKLITGINYNDPFFKGVFQKQIRNFQYPHTSLTYPATISKGNKLLIYEDQDGFITRKTMGNGNLYWISSPLDNKTTNFNNSPLIIPVFYNFSQKNTFEKGLYFEIGKDNSLEIPAIPDKHEVVHIVNKETSFIPRQEQRSDKVIIHTKDKPYHPGIYQIKNQDSILKNVAYNYSNSESILHYTSLQEFAENNDHIFYFKDMNTTFNSINDQNKTKDLWQLFLIFALIFLIIEILLQRLL